MEVALKMKTNDAKSFAQVVLELWLLIRVEVIKVFRQNALHAIDASSSLHL